MVQCTLKAVIARPDGPSHSNKVEGEESYAVLYKSNLCPPSSSATLRSFILPQGAMAPLQVMNTNSEDKSCLAPTSSDFKSEVFNIGYRCSKANGFVEGNS